MKNLGLKISTFMMLAALVASPAFAGISQADDAAKSPLDIQENELVLGDADAPVTIIEYASMTCGHCAHFHNDTFGQIKENYIETGKVKFVLRSLPWDGLAAAVTKIMHCAPDGGYYNFADAYFSTQQTWTRSDDPVAELKKIARLGGMDGEAVDACIMNQEVQKRVLDDKATALETLNIRSTPTFYINKKIVVAGAQPYEVMKEKIEQALKDAK